MRLANEDVALRSWRGSDAPWIAAMTADPVVARWSSMGDDIAGWVDRQRARAPGMSLAVTRADGDRPLGKVALRLDAPGLAELSYWLVPDARGRGLARAATRLYTSWAFEALGLREIVLDIEEDNAPSLAVAAALGAVPVRRRSEVDRQGVRRALSTHALTATAAPAGR